MQELNCFYRLINKQITSSRNFGISKACNMDQEAEIFKPRGTQNDFLTRSTARGEARRTRQRSRQPYWKSAGMSCEEAKLPTSLKNISSQKRRYGEGVEYRMNKYSRIEQAKNL